MIQVGEPFFMYIQEETRADKINQVISYFQQCFRNGQDINDYELQKKIYQQAGVDPNSVTEGEKRRIVQAVEKTTLTKYRR